MKFLKKTHARSRSFFVPTTQQKRLFTVRESFLPMSGEQISGAKKRSHFRIWRGAYYVRFHHGVYIFCTIHSLPIGSESHTVHGCQEMGDPCRTNGRCCLQEEEGKNPHAVRIDNNEMTSAQIDSSDAVGRWLVAVERIFI